MKSKKILSIALVVVMVCVLLTACMPSSYEKAKENLESNDYLVTSTKGSIAKLAFLKVDGIDDLEQVVTGINSDGDYVVLYYFSSASSAKKAYKDIIEDEKKDNDDESDVKYGRNGKCIYFGSKEGVKAAK